MDIFKNLILGILIGMGNIIPGVSGSTVAVVFNIYEKFVNAITFNVKKLWQNRRFVIPIVLGMLLGVVLFSKIITILYSTYPVQTNCLFTGLIIGSIPMLFRHVIKRETDSKISLSSVISIILCILAGLALIVWLSFIEGNADTTSDLRGSLPPVTFMIELKIFIAGIFGAVAMVVPGISGSIFMLVLGVYTTITASIQSIFIPQYFVHALLLLLPNGLGVLAGLVTSARLVSILIKKVPRQTYAVICGFLLGSIYNIFPRMSCFTDSIIIISGIISVLCGASLAFFSSKYSKD